MTDSNNKSELEYISDKTHNNTAIASIAASTTTTTTTTDTSTKLKLADLLDKDGHVTYDDDRWTTLISQLTFNEMLSLVNNGAFQTVAIESIGKNLTNDSDGPVGFVNFMNKSAYVGNTTFVCESVLGATWNKDLAYQMGKAVGDNGYWGDVNGNGLPYSGWYAPAVNLHRSPFSGRNFEYYSEDPILSGKMAVNVINGAAQKGVYTDLKHFALNDQETNRSGIATYCTEQALRELYLKPFEIAVKADDDATQVPSAVKDKVTEYKGTTGIMSSFNRIGTRWTGGDYRLLTEILRNEWGFKGLVISDYKTGNSYMDSRQMLYAGNDLILASLPGLLWTDASESNPQDVAILRQSAKNILYTVANSNSVNVTITGYTMEWWMATLIAVDVIVPVGLAVWGFFVIRSYIKKGKEAE
jgi:beta-glucosidase